MFSLFKVFAWRYMKFFLKNFELLWNYPSDLACCSLYHRNFNTLKEQVIAFERLFFKFFVMNNTVNKLDLIIYRTLHLTTAENTFSSMHMIRFLSKQNHTLMLNFKRNFSHVVSYRNHWEIWSFVSTAPLKQIQLSTFIQMLKLDHS